MENVIVYYESETQIIIGVTLPDGRRFSIDLRGKRPQTEEAQEVLANGHITGVTVN